MNFRNLIVGAISTGLLTLFSCGVEAVNTGDLQPAETYSESEGEALTQAQIANLRDAISGDYENKSMLGTVFISKISFAKDGKVVLTEDCFVCDMAPADSTGTYTISYTTLKLDLTHTFSGQKSTRKFTYVVLKSLSGKKTLYLREVKGTVIKFESVAVKPPSSLWPPNATRILVENKGGGFGPQPPPDSDCFGQTTYDLNVATRTLTYKVCTFVDWNTAFKWNSGTVALTSQQVASVIAAGNALKKSTANVCGADKPVLEVTAFSGSTSKVFGDDFYACWKTPGVTYVSNIDSMFNTISAFVPKAPSSLWPANVSRVVVEDKGGGFTPPPPAGSQCGFGEQSYDLEVASGTLNYSKCNFIDWKTPLTLTKGTKILTPQQVAKVIAAGTQLKATTEDVCGADKSILQVTAYVGSKSFVFGDDFYACWKQPGVTYVSNIGIMFDAVGVNSVP